MWMSQLAEAAGLPVATVKFYQREGLLHPGEATGATRARYDETHVRRLRLVRALTEVAGLRLDAVRDVLAAVDDPAASWHEAVGAAHTRLAAETPEASEAALARVEAFLARHDWHLGEDSTHRATLARALDVLDGLDHAAPDELLDTYAEAAELLARREVGALPAEDRTSAAEQAVIGTLLLEPVLLTIRRMAQETESWRTRR